MSSSSMAIKKPVQLKTRIGEVRERLRYFATKTEDGSLKHFSNLVESYKYLLSTELLLRGISLSQQVIEQNSSIKLLLEHIANVAGKPLLSDLSSFPNPVLAATCALNGIVAEQCSSLSHIIQENQVDSPDEALINCIKKSIATTNTGNTTKKGPITSSMAAASSAAATATASLLLTATISEDNAATDASLVSSIQIQFLTAIQRCQDVKDLRFLALLRISSAFDQNIKYFIQQQQHQSSTSLSLLLRKTFENLSICFLAIARGHYLLGASSFAAEDQPNLWRKALDIIVSIRQQLSPAEITKKYYTVDAILPLSYLARISFSKGNTIKAIEWSINLAEAHLGEDSEQPYELSLLLLADTTNTHDQQNLIHYIATFFTPPPSANNNIKLYYYCNVFIAAATAAATSESKKASSLSTYPNPLKFILDLKQRASDGKKALHQYYAEHIILENLDEESQDDGQKQREEKDDLLLKYHMISYRLSEAFYEYGEIQLIGHELFRRSTDEDTLSRLEKKRGFEKKAWKQLVFTLSSIQDDNNEDVATSTARPDEFAKQLFGNLLKQCLSSSSTNKGINTNTLMLMEESLILLDHHIGKLIDRAQIISLAGKKKNPLQQGWEAVLTFALHLLQNLQTLHDYWGKSNDDSSVLPLFNMTVSVCKAILIASWMMVMNNTTTNFNDDGSTRAMNNLLPQITENDVALVILNLQHVLDQISQQLKDSNHPSNNSKVFLSDAAGKKRSLEVAAISSIEVALAGARCRQMLTKEKDEDGSSAQAIGDLAQLYLKLSKFSLISEHAKYGTAFLHCVLSWSGLVQRPWQFSSVTQARTMISLAKSAFVESHNAWGRCNSRIERIVIELAEADAEASLPGGIVVRAKEIYEKILSENSNRTNDGNDSSEDNTLDDDSTRHILLVHCICGLTQLHLNSSNNIISLEEENDREVNSRKCLELIMSVNMMFQEERKNMFITTPVLFQYMISDAIPYHLCLARQCVAECFCRRDRMLEAQKFLEDSYRDFPNNFDAAFALGAFHLQRILHSDISHNNLDPTEKKVVSNILLKAAKLSIFEADPFALLGWWYELVGDVKRSLGCYSKALLLNPTHPVAGRGIVRLRAFADIKVTCKKAGDSTSSENGWAWWALGRFSAFDMGRDENAATFFQQALRCRDIEKPECNRLHPFYGDPKRKRDASEIEVGLVWIDLANCYRRQGKLNAAASAFSHASIVLRCNLSSSAACCWAQVELALGFRDEANERFKALLKADSCHPIAAFGHATCLLDKAKVCATEGKNGLALEKLKEASCALQGIVFPGDNLSEGAAPDSQYLCALKLWGDLHSFGYFLPSDVFVEFAVTSDVRCSDEKLAFVTKGEGAYRCVLKSVNSLSKDSTFLAAAAFDVGANILSQAWIFSASMGEGSGGNSPTTIFDIAKHEKVKGLLRKAAEIFVFAIECNPLVSPAWCGLGCSLIATEPLKGELSDSPRYPWFSSGMV